MPVSMNDLKDAYAFVSGGGGEHQAFVCRQTGRIYWRSEINDDLDELPDDIEDGTKYIEIPDQRDLDLGTSLVFEFVRRFLPNDCDRVGEIFRRRGAYARFKDLLRRSDTLDQWHDFEAKAEERALREWCDLNSIAISD